MSSKRKRKPLIEIVVGNVGLVFQTNDADEASKVFAHYIALSTLARGSLVYGEDVTVLVDGCITDDYVPVNATLARA